MKKTMPYRGFLPVLLLALIQFTTACSHKESVPYLDDMPRPAKVIKAFKGKTETETYAKQIGALNQMNALIDILEEYQPTDHQKAEALKQTYREAAEELRNTYKTQGLKAGRNESSLEVRVSYYSNNDNFQIDVVNNVLPSAARLTIIKMDNEIEVKQNNKGRLISGAVMIACLGGGILLLVWVFRIKHKLQRYEFEHRTSGGVVEFPTYEASLWHHRKKVFSDYMLIAATLLMIIGGLALVNMR